MSPYFGCSVADVYVTVYFRLVQICYQVGYYSAAQQACEVLWNHFLATPPSPEGDKYTTQAKKDFKLTLLKYDPFVNIFEL